jgi:hypothetical protein
MSVARTISTSSSASGLRRAELRRVFFAADHVDKEEYALVEVGHGERDMAERLETR